MGPISEPNYTLHIPRKSPVYFIRPWKQNEQREKKDDQADLKKIQIRHEN